MHTITKNKTIPLRSRLRCIIYPGGLSAWNLVGNLEIFLFNDNGFSKARALQNYVRKLDLIEMKSA